MTLEETFEMSFVQYDILKKTISALENRIVELQSRIKELEEPNNCEGCMYEKGTDYSCFRCERYYAGDDFYEPKET